VWFQKISITPAMEGIGNSEGAGKGKSKSQEIPEERRVRCSIWFPDALRFNMDSSISLAVH